MNAHPSRGEIWQVDMGIAWKVRPCLLLTDYPANDELALVTVVSHTTALRGNEWEVVPQLMRRLGSLAHEEWNLIAAKLVERLGLVV
jgi:mRNA interferase MazF